MTHSDHSFSVIHAHFNNLIEKFLVSTTYTFFYHYIVRKTLKKYIQNNVIYFSKYSQSCTMTRHRTQYTAVNIQPLCSDGNKGHKAFFCTSREVLLVQTLQTSPAGSSKLETFLYISNFVIIALHKSVSWSDTTKIGNHETSSVRL